MQLLTLGKCFLIQGLVQLSAGARMSSRPVLPDSENFHQIYEIWGNFRAPRGGEKKIIKIKTLEPDKTLVKFTTLIVHCSIMIIIVIIIIIII